jgi:hypothetical protein
VRARSVFGAGDMAPGHGVDGGRCGQVSWTVVVRTGVVNEVVVENRGLRLFMMPKLSVGKSNAQFGHLWQRCSVYWATWSVRGTRIFICLML